MQAGHVKVKVRPAFTRVDAVSVDIAASGGVKINVIGSKPPRHRSQRDSASLDARSERPAATALRCCSPIRLPMRNNVPVRYAAFWISVVLGLLGIALPVVGVPEWLAWSLIGACALILAALVAAAVFGRYFTVQREQSTLDPDLPVRDDRRDLADDLEQYAEQLANWLDARSIEAPTIIRNNTAAIGESNLAAMLRIKRDEPDRWEGHQQAAEHYDRVIRTEYLLGWRSGCVCSTKPWSRR